MGEPMDFNEARRKRAMSERRFTLGPYTFKRRPTVPPDVLAAYANAGNDGDDANTIRVFESALLDLVEPQAVVTETNEPVSTTEAWEDLRVNGDENDVIGFQDIAAVTRWLIEGVAERPTGLPSDSLDGSSIPLGGISSMATSPPEASPSTI